MTTTLNLLDRAFEAYAQRRTNAETEERAERGFSLIELLVVVLILGVLAAVAIPVYLSQVNSANENATKAAAATAKATFAADIFTAQVGGGTVNVATVAADAAKKASTDGNGGGDIVVTAQNTTSADTVTFCAAKGDVKYDSNGEACTTTP